MTEVYKLLDSEKLGLTLELSAIVNSTIHLTEVISLVMKYVNNVVKSA